MKISYYAVIPAFIRYDKDLSPNAKLLYGEITALCNEKGYCWATNNYFCELYGVSERTIQRLLIQLNDKKYISIVIENNRQRKIYLNDYPDKNDGVGVTKMSYSHDKIVALNNTKNIKKNNKEYLEDFLDYDWLNEI